MPRSRGSGSGGRSARREIDPAAHPAPACRSRRSRPGRADLRDRARDARSGRLGRRSPADRLWDPGAGRRATADAVPRRPARSVLAIASAMVVAIDRWRVRRVNPAVVAASFAVLLVLVIVGFIVLASYNDVVALRQRIDKAWANIDVVLKQRHDQLPNLVAAVRGLMAYERDVLTRVTEAAGRVRADGADPRPGRRRPRRRAPPSAPCSRSSSATRTSSPRPTSRTCRTRSSVSRG